MKELVYISVFSLSPVILILAFLLDLAIGDPKRLPHPVRIIGNAVTRLESLLRKNLRTPSQEKTAGILLVIYLVVSVFLITSLSMRALSSFNDKVIITAGVIIIVYFTSTTIATRELINSAKLIFRSINNKNIEQARRRLGMIVGRDTDSLDEKAILRATIESLAENASDGIIAPLFYLAIGGLPLAITYKAINTLDSMVGYKNKKYRHFGWAAARLDDIANYIPARITGLLIVASTFILTLFKNTRYSHDESGQALLVTRYSLKTMLRDGRRHSSPNSGVPEAAMAGALGLQLGGPSTYGGIVVEKAFIGENLVSPQNNSQGVLPRMSGRIPDLSSEGNMPLLDASEKAISIVKVTSVLGLGFSLIIQYLRIILL